MDSLRVLVSVSDPRLGPLLISSLQQRGHTVVSSEPWALSATRMREMDALVIDADQLTSQLTEPGKPTAPWPPVFAYVAEPTLDRLEALSQAGATGFLFGDESPEQLFAQLLIIEIRAGERARQQSQARAAAEALLATRARSDAVLNALPDLMFRVSRTGVFLDYRAENPATLAVPEDQILGATLHDLLPPEVADPALETIQRALTTMDVELLEYELEKPSGKRDYEARIVACNPDQVVILARDVTERKQLAAQLAMADRLSALGTLIAGIAHEINNPLTYVLIGIDAVARELQKQDPDRPIGARIEVMRQRLSDALGGAKRVRRIVGELKAFSRADQEPHRAVDIRRVIDRVCSMVHDEIYARGRLARAYGAIPAVVGSEDLLTQVFLHVLLNATHALSPQTRDTNEILVATCTNEEGDAVIEVADTGHGIAPSDLDKIFDPFFTTKPQGVGTGLGLWMSRTIVARYGGSIRVDSTRGEGARVTIELPAAAERHDGAEPAASAPGLAPGSRVLVIDEDRQVAEELSGFEVTHVVTGAEALAALSERAFDLILCELLLQDQTGMELFEHIRSRAPGTEHRIVFMTGHTFTPAIRSFLARVSNVCVSKPIGSGTLDDVLRGRHND